MYHQAPRTSNVEPQDLWLFGHLYKPQVHHKVRRFWATFLLLLV